MRARGVFAGSAILLAAAMVAIAAEQSPSPNPPASSSSPQAQQQQSTQSAQSPQTTQSNYAMQVNTHVVTLDVVATDSHDNVVRDLKPEEFEVSDDGPQKISHFVFVDKSANGAVAKPASAVQPRPKGFYTNQAKFDNLTMPPTVVLMDALNSDIGNIVETRQHMLHLLKTLPVGAPVAVFLLGQSLVVVQDFTSDPALLRAALDKTIKPATPLDPAPENDPNAPSLVAFDENGEDFVTRTLEGFEKQTYSNILDFRVRTTVDSLMAIARYLGGYPGRKNLIWVSASFPITVHPDSDFGSQGALFAGVAGYADEVREASMALSNAQVAVYPVDVRGLETNQVFSATQDTVIRPGSRSRSMPAQLNHEDDARAMAQGTMDKVAEDTGGKPCKNTNDLSGCVGAALADSSSYYELAYYPQNVKWDGGFHTISVKTTRHGVKLTYRRGYFAEDAETLAQSQPPEKRLQQACQDFLPSTAIPITAQAVPSAKPDEIQYLMSVPPGTLSLTPDGQSHKLSARMATCVYSANGSSFRFTTRNLSRTLSGADFNALQTSGLHGYLDAPKADTVRVRITVLDLGTGLTGALDIPIHPEDFENATASPAALLPESTSPAPSPGNPPSLPAHSITFHSSSGAAGALDWDGDSLSYHGDVGVGQAAPAYFHNTLGVTFHCEDGELIPRDASDAKPDLHFNFKNPTGQTAGVDLTGSDPQYSGDLPVDPSAKPFFETLWYLCHCRASQP